MPNNTSIELQVSLGLQAAQSQIGALRKALQESVKVDSSAFKTIDTALSSTIRQVNKLRSEMSNAFKTSAGSSKFLKDYEKLFESLSSIGDRFNFLKEADMIFSPDTANKLGEYRNELKQLQQEIDQINSGKIGKIFDDTTKDEFKTIRDAAAELKVNLSSTTFDSFKTKLSDSMIDTQKEIETTKNQIKKLEAVANSATLSKDSILNSFTEKNVGEGTLSKVISDTTSAKKLRDEITEAYKEFGIGADSKPLGSSIRANSNITSIFVDQEKVINESAEQLKETLSKKQKEIEEAWTELTTMKTTNHDASGNLVNWEEKLEKVKEISQKFSEISISAPSNTTATTGKGITAYLDQVIQELVAGANNLKVEDFQEALRQKIAEAINNATTKDIITDTKKFSDQVKTALTEIFGNTKFDIDFNQFKGSSISDAFSSIIASVQAQLKDTNIDDLKTKVEELKEKLHSLQEVDKVVDTTQQSESSGLETKRQRIEELIEAISKLLGVESAAIKGKIASALQQDGEAAEKARTAIEDCAKSLDKFENKQKALSNIQSAVTRWMGFYQVLNLTKRAINDMKKHIQELDTVMTKIAVVTNMTQDDLWSQIGTYSEIARQYGVAIKGVYEVSQIYYQQGLNKNDVMGLTTETLKMARIAGIDYATAADYMTTAIRGFKMEMSEANHVTDVFSNLAAHTASSTEELATAISKTAASAASVGASFEATSAMMATMIATTRESATNIGTALKSIIARYGELKQNMTGTDAEGEEYSLNKVDTALQSVGISIHDAAGQFRDFDDVILELAESWDTIDKNTQRYIATVMAGNRQQSRFLALVSNVEEYKRALELANNSDDVGELQVLKTLDSVDAKIEKMKVTIQEFYTSSGIQDLYKNILDTITNVISAANDLPKAFGNIPVTAIAVGLQIVSTIKTVLTLIIASIQMSLERIKASGKNAFSSIVNEASKAGTTAGQRFKANFESQMQQLASSGKSWLTKILSTDAGRYIGTIAASALSTGAAALTLSATNAYGSSRTGDEDRAAANSMFASAAMNGLSGFISGTIMGGPIVGALSGIVNLLPSLISGLSMNNVTLAREIELQSKVATESKQEATKKKGQVSELSVARDKLESLQEASIKSAESLQEYKDYMNQLADTYPELISRIELTGDKTITLADLEEKLAAARTQSAYATIQSIKDEIELKNKQIESYENLISGKGLPASISSNNLDFSFFEAYIRQYGNDFQRTALEAGSPYAAILDLYNANRSRFGGKEIYKENRDNWNDNYNEKRISENLESLNDLQSYLLTLPNTTDLLKTQLKNNLSDFLKETGGEVSLAELTEGKITDLTDLNNDELKIEDLINLIKLIRTHAQNYVDSMENQIQGLDDTLNRAELQLTVDNELGTKKIKNKSLSDYSSFITSMLEYQYKDQDWSTDQGKETAKQATKWWEEWLQTNLDNADWLMNNLDFTQIKDKEGLLKILSEHGLTEDVIGSEFINNISEDFEQSREDVIKTYQDSLMASLNITKWSETAGIGGHYGLYQLFNNYTGDNKELTQVLAENLQSQMYGYKQLLDNDQKVLADNYIKGLENSFLIIGAHDTDYQNAVSSIIMGVDWSDSSSLQSAADRIRDLGPEYEELAVQLELAATRFSTNLTTQVLQLKDAAVDTSKSIEKLTGSIGKVTKPSEALENVNTMLESYIGDDKDTITFDSIYEWNGALNGYVLTSKGIQVWLDSINQKNTEKLEEATNTLKELQAIYGADKETQGLIFDAEEALDRDSILSAITSVYTDENGKLTISSDEIEAKTDAFMADYESLQERFHNQTELSWEEFVEQEKENLIIRNEKDIEALKQMPQYELISAISSIDYSAIAGGTATSGTRQSLEALLQEAGVSEDKLGEGFNTIWNEMLKGNFDSFNSLLTESGINFQIDATTASESLKSEFQQYSDGLSEILTKPVSAWSDKTKEIANIDATTDLTTIDIIGTAEEFLDRINELVALGQATIEDQQAAITKVIKYRQEQVGVGKEKTFYDSLTDGFTVDELVKLGGFDSEGHLISALEGLVEEDEVTGDFKVIVEGTTEEILDQLSKALGITLTKEGTAYKKAVSSGVDEAINTRASENKGKLIAQQVKNISSATVDDEININELTPAMKTALGVDAAAETLTIESESRRDALLLLLESSIKSYSGEGRDALIAIYNQIKNSIESNKVNQGTALTNMLSKTVTKATAQDYMESTGLYSDAYIENADAWLQNVLKYEYYAFTDTYTATTDSLKALDTLIANAKKPESGASEEYISSLEVLYKDLEYELSNGERNNAILNILQNYTAATNEQVAALKLAFSGENIDWDSIIKYDETTNTSVIDTKALQEALISIGYTLNDAAQKEINTIVDSYISNIETAASLVSSGTSSVTDMNTFVSSYNEMFKDNKTVTDLFSWNDVLKAWTLDPSILNTYVRKQAELLVSQGQLAQDEVNKWIKEQTTIALASNVNISDYLLAEDISTERDKLVETMTQYYKSFGRAQSDINEYITADLKALDAGGEAAVKVVQTWAQRQGRQATESEIEEAFNHAAEQLTDAIDSLENLTIGQLTAGKLRQHLARLGKVDKNGVVTSVEGMADVYISIYEEMKTTAGITKSSLNSTLAKILDEQDKTRTDALETLENAAGMTYETFFELLESYGKDVEEVLANADKYGIQGTGFGKIRIANFDKFASEMGWDINSPEYYAAYSDYADSMAELQNMPATIMQNASDELNTLIEAKMGQGVNVSYLERALGQVEDGEQSVLNALAKKYKVLLENGVITFTNETDIKGLIAEISQIAADSGALLPEQLAELADAISDLLTGITNIISNGITGSISNSDAQKLNTWYREQQISAAKSAAESQGIEFDLSTVNIKDLDFTQTAEGLKLSEDSAVALYNTMKQVDTLQAQVVFKDLYENLKSSNDEFKTASKNAANMAELEEKINVNKHSYQETAGNVDLISHARNKISGTQMIKAGWTDFNESDYATLYTSTYSGDEYDRNVVLNITPITNDGTEILGPEDLDNYVADLMSKSSNAEEILLNDEKGLVSGAWDVDVKDAEKLANAVADAGDAATTLHEESEAIAENISEWDEPSDARIQQYEEELALAREIEQVRATTEDDSFSFMDNDIPSGQNNPINYLQNWSDAFEAISDAGENNNTMDYTDFYNIITELGNLADATGGIVMDGEVILANSEEAASLIEKGAAALSVSADGSVVVDLSQLGIDFVSGADSLKESVNEGIKEVAQSQIDMLDSMIQLLEAIVAMEELGDIDVEGNEIDFNDFFKLVYNEDTGEWERDYTQFSEGYQDYVDYIKGRIDKDSENYNKDLANYYANTTLKTSSGQTVSMSDIINWTPSDFTNEANRDVVDMYAAVLQAYKEAAESNDWDNDHIMDSITSILGGKDIEGEIEISGMTLSFHSGAVIQKKGENEYVWEGKTFTSLDAATNAYKLSEFSQIEGEAGKYNKDTGNIEMVALDVNGGEIDISVHYDVDNTSQPYTATFSDGGSVSSDSAEGLSAAIKTYCQLTNLTLDETKGATQEENKVLKYSITQKGAVTVNVEADLETGEVTVNQADSNSPESLEAALNLSDISAAATVTTQEIIVTKNETKEAEEENKANAESGVTQNINNDKNATGDAEEDNKKNAKDGVVQNIRNEINQTKAKLEENIRLAAKGISQDINLGTNSVIEQINANVEYAKNNPVIQSVETSGTDTSTTVSGGFSGTKAAEGNVGLAKAAGTLMGELGPELVVSNGRYFVAGQNGAEFVNLSDDAIVFNHLQTQSLLKNGMSSTRGRAVTNERNAISFAKGNINGGPAMASASAALATLRQLRAEWQSLLNLSTSDLSNLGGGGSSGGGGGSSDTAARSSYIADVERWYNWLQKIAQLEEDITLEEKKRSKLSSSLVADGESYAKSNLKTLANLKEQAITNQALLDTQTEYFEKRRSELNNGIFNKLYTFDENGQIKYNDTATINGNKGGYTFLADLMAVDDYGKPKYSSEEQYNILQAAGFGDYMKYDSSGTEITQDEDSDDQSSFYSNSVQAFWDVVDGQKEEMQSLHDSINDYEEAVIEAQTEANEILKEIEDNQIAVEDKVLSALTDIRQREIDELQDQRDAIEESAQKVIDGLSSQLAKERDMYTRQESQDELGSLQRQLAILQSSGGSASQIASLQKDINSKQQDAYFDAQQAQIDALQDATDAQLEKLDAQIDLMTETLEYEKANGLLWLEVESIMQQSPQEIADYIFANDSQFWGESPTKQTQSYREALFEAQQFVTYRDEITGGITNLASEFSDDSIATAAKLEEISNTLDLIANSSSGSGSSSSGSSSDDSSGSSGSTTGDTTSPGGSGKSWHVDGLSGSYATKDKAIAARNAEYTRLSTLANTYSINGQSVKAAETNTKAKTIKNTEPEWYKQGGLNDYTGLAMLHGSKSKPEAVLTAEQTSILRNEILSNKPTSLLSLLTDFNDAYNDVSNTSKYTTTTNNSGTNIEQAIVEMHVSKIDNDYDAQRAGEQALEKMVQIARKTSGQRIGR